MRVAYVCADRGVPVFGSKGCSIHVQELIRALRRVGVSVDLFAANASDAPPPELADVEVTVLPRFAALSRAPSDVEVEQANLELVRLLDRIDRFDFIYERHSLWSVAAISAGRDAGRPTVLEINAPLVEEARRHRGLERVEAAERLAEEAIRGATRVVAVSEQVARYVRALDPRPGRVAIVPNGVNPRRFAARRRPPGGAYRGPGARPFCVGFVGSMKPWHGIDVLARSFERVASVIPAATLLLVGDGPDRTKTAASLADAGLSDRVEWTGAVPPAAIPSLLGRMDVGVAPYPPGDSYFSPLKVFEYLAAGLPVVASRTGQLADLLLDGRTALLVPPGDADALAVALERLAADPALRCRLGGAGRLGVESEHTWDRVATRVLHMVRAHGPSRVRAGAAS